MHNEAERLAALARYHILDTPPEKVFDDVVKLVSELLDAPIAAVNLIAQGRQWFKSEIGLGTREMPLDDSICKIALFEQDRMIVPDTLEDSRFNCNPLVTGEPGLRFYAGELLKTPEGLPLGTLCVLDVKPRPGGLTQQQQFVLQTLAQQIIAQMELRKLVHEQNALLLEQRRIEEELRLEQDRSFRLLQGMDEGFVFLDFDYRIRQISPGGLKMDGRTEAELIGLTHWEAWPGSDQLPVADALRRVMTQRVAADLEQVYVFPDGRKFWLDVRAYPAEGGIALFYRNISERKEAEQRLRQTAQRLEFTLEAAKIGDWDLDLINDTSHRSLRHDQCFGYAEPIPDWGFETFIQHVHPEDRDAVAKQFEAALSEMKDWHFECRVVWPDKTIHWIEAHGSIYHVDSKPTRMSGIVYDITPRKQTEEALRQADRRKDEFLAMLAHELRNPLAPISAAAELLSFADLEPLRVRQTSEVIRRQVRHMTGLVDDLLDVSRVTRGLAVLEKNDVDVKRVVASAVEQVSPLIEAKQHHLAINLAPKTAHVLGDQKRLVQVVTNLLNNAAKYTPEGGHIELTMEVYERQVKLHVKDNGVGISPDLQPHVFDLFSQASRSADRSQGGLGLGLALARSLIDLHGGKVACFSEGTGKGSCFTVTLPKLVQHEDSRAHPASSHCIQPARRGLRIMVVDDNVDAAQMLAMLLEAAGHDVLVENNSLKALETAKITTPDAYILDIGLPEIDGYQLAQRLRSQPETEKALLVAVTGYGQEQDRKYALAVGFDHHMAKPVEPEKLAAILADIGSA